jgi:PAS domain S-box-containing protein
VTLNSIGDAVMSCNAAGRIEFINPKAEDLTGWKTEEVAGKPISEVLLMVDEDNGSQMEDPASLALRLGHAIGHSGSSALVSRNGSRIPVEETAAPILGSSGEVAGAVVVFHDVAEERRARKELWESEKRYRSLVETSPVAVIVHQNFRFVYANAAGLQLHGARSLEELQTKTILELVHPDDHQAVRERVLFSERGGSSPLREVRILRLDGSAVAVEAASANIEWRGEVAVQSVLRDVTERKRAEAALIQSEKLASVGRMAASVAHEINNPLAAAMNTLYIARNTAGLPATALQYMNIADEELKRISYITRQVLGFYRETGVLTRVALNEIVESALDLLQSRIRAKHATIAKEYRGNLEVTTTRGELRQVFSNLLANSLDAIPDHGTVTIRISGGHFSRSGARMVRVIIADNGPGIRPEIWDRVFEPLFTTKLATGTGLGLWVSKQILENHGGSIRFRTVTEGPRRGTVFSVVLPAECEAGAASAQAL